MDECTFLRLVLVFLMTRQYLREARETYMIVDVPEDFLGRDYEIDHFPYCLEWNG